MKTGVMEIESFLIYRTIFQVSAYSLLFPFLQLCNSLAFLLDSEMHIRWFSQNKY